MNLTDEAILVIAGEVMGLTTTGKPCFNGEPREVIDFARAILKEAGVEGLEDAAFKAEVNADLALIREGEAVKRKQGWQRAAERYQWMQENPKEAAIVLLGGSSNEDMDNYLDGEVRYAKQVRQVK